MIYVSAQTALGILIFDITMLTTALLFRKPKLKLRTSIPDLRQSKPIGYYLIGSAITVLVLGHFAFYMNYLNYLEGLLIDAFLFYLGLKVVVQNE